jgi:uncharacterized protein (TIGR02145 family)
MNTNIPKFLIFLMITGIGLTLITGCKKSAVEPITEVPLPAGQVKDASGNIYHTVTIGTQVWMVENLKTTKFQNGDAIPQDMTAAWGTLTTAAYCDYENLPKNGEDYGHLYNWYAVNDARKLAPVGWHVASNAEWATLLVNFGGEANAASRLKETGAAHWELPNTGTDSGGFKALPGGNRAIDGVYYRLTTNAYWWTSTEGLSGNATSRTISAASLGVIVSAFGKSHGFSVRCVKD